MLFTSIALVSCSSQNSKLQRAELFQTQERWPEALAIYEQLLAQIPSRDRQLLSEVYGEIGYCALKVGRAGESLASLEKAIEINPANDRARTYLIKLYIAAGVPERAEPQAQYLLEHRPDDIQTVTALASLYAAEDKNDAAEKLLLKVFRVDRQRVGIAEILAELYDEDQKIDAARSILREAASAQPHNPNAVLQLARIEEQEGNNAAAEQAYHEAVAAADTIETNLRLAQFLQRASKLKEAQAVLKKIDSMRPEAPFSVADMEFITGHWTDALRNYQSVSNALEKNQTKPSNESLQPAAGARMVEAEMQVALRQSRSPEISQSALSSARLRLSRFRASLDPVTLSVLESEIALASSDLSRARSLAESAIASGSRTPAAHYVLGMAKYQEGNVQEAISEWESAIETDPQYFPAHLALATAELQQNHLDKAEEYVTEVVREEPANVDALLLYARVLLVQHRYDSARFLAMRAGAADESSAEPHILLGEIALARRHRTEALLELEKAILLDPNSASAMKTLTALYGTGAITRPMLKRMEATASAPPASATLMELAGRLYADHGWYADARRCLRQAIQFDNSRSTPVAALAKTYVAEKKSGSKDFFNSVAPPKLWDRGSSTLLAALQAQQEGNEAVAIEKYEAALRQGDNSGAAANNLAWIYAQQPGKGERALALAEEAFGTNPRDPAVLDTLGYVLLQRREYSRALDILTKAKGLLSKTAASSDKEFVATLKEHLRAASLHSGQPELVTQASNFVGSSTSRTREHN